MELVMNVLEMQSLRKFATARRAKKGVYRDAVFEEQVPNQYRALVRFLKEVDLADDKVWAWPSKESRVQLKKYTARVRASHEAARARRCRRSDGKSGLVRCGGAR